MAELRQCPVVGVNAKREIIIIIIGEKHQVGKNMNNKIIL